MPEVTVFLSRNLDQQLITNLTLPSQPIERRGKVTKWHAIDAQPSIALFCRINVDRDESRASALIHCAHGIFTRTGTVTISSAGSTK